ncbi:hypothetical protein SDC9_98585 [bioreactor metagenome]|uniref:Uncharacterized protein n=1 Tax=bioreactor metagenome TaxID=1076179 RepID=A0A645AQG2_9ZZZZ
MSVRHVKKEFTAAETILDLLLVPFYPDSTIQTYSIIQLLFLKIS